MKDKLSTFSFRSLLILLLCCVQLSFQQDCSAANPCALGCCSSSGWCGMGPDFCTKPTCVANCDAKSECDPGWGKQWSNSTKCPLNVCCSKFGFCGTSDDFCDGTKVEKPSCSAESTSIQKVIGYYESWSLAERSCNGMAPEQIPFGIYTHINFAFATIDPKTFEVKASSAAADDLMKRMNNVKLFQKGVEVWVAIGGWTFSDADQPTANTFSELAASTTHQETFANSLISMMNTYGFDGVDIDWEYPRADDRSGKPEDYKNMVSWMKSLKSKLGTKGLSITIPSSFWYLQHFDIVSMEPYVDWFNVMLYDLHGSWDLLGNYPMPYANSHTNLTEIQSALDLLWRNDINPDKVVFDPTCSTTGCPISSGGNPGECSGTAGVLLNPEIQSIILENKLTPKLDEKAAVKTISWGNQWVSYDDADTWAIKTKLLKEQCIKNVMVWAISHDDLNGTYAKSLMKGIGREVMEVPVFGLPQTVTPPSIVGTCKWTNCNEMCPAGFKNVPRDGTIEMMVDGSRCSGLSPSQFCCPADDEQPTCRWRGHKNSGACKPGCNSDEVEVGTLSVGCSSRHQSACCTSLPAVEAYNDCKWVGSAGQCAKSGSHADCPSDYPKFIVSSSAGAGGEQVCTQGSKSYCCKDPAPSQWTNCEWHRKASNHLPAEFMCETSCPDNSIRIARHKGNCVFGYQAYCCAGAPPPAIVQRDPTFENGVYSDFSNLIDEYMKDTTCPARTFADSPGDLFYDTPMKRSDLSIRQGPPCSRSNFRNLVQYVSRLISNVMLLTEGLQALWNTQVADHIDIVLRLYSLANELHDTQWNSFNFVNGVLLDPVHAALGMRQRAAARSELCILSPPVIATRNFEHLLGDRELPEKNVTDRPQSGGDLEDRWINPSAVAGTAGDERTDGAPLMLTVIRGINDGHLTMHYARWQHIPNAGGPTLELAYWIGQHPGVTPTAEEEAEFHLDNYRDRRPGHTGIDRWVVVHIHFHRGSAGAELLAEIDGHVYIGTRSIRIYHGQRVVNYRDASPRVEFDQEAAFGTNERSGVFTCPDSRRWYIGAPLQFTNRPQPTLLTDQLHTWGQGLWTNHYLDSVALRYIFMVAEESNEEIYIRNRQPELRLTRNNLPIASYNWVYDSQGRFIENPDLR